MRTERWKNARGEGFRVLVWPTTAQEPPRSLLLIHHGHGEHAGRYARLADALAHLPVEIRAFDARGHGESDGVRGRIRGIDQLVADLAEILPAQLAASGLERVTLFGHSMGGAVIARYLETQAPHPAIRSVIFSSPLLRATTSFV